MWQSVHLQWEVFDSWGPAQTTVTKRLIFPYVLPTLTRFSGFNAIPPTSTNPQLNHQKMISPTFRTKSDALHICCMALRHGLRSSVQIVPHPTALIRRARRARRGHRRRTSTEGRGTGLEGWRDREA